MKKRGFLITFIVLLVSILAYHYFYNFEVRIQPPSEQWSKEVLISKGNTNTNLKIIKLQQNYYVAHDDGSSVKVIKLDELGHKLKEKTFKAESDLVTGITLCKKGEELSLAWTTSKADYNVLHYITLDGSLAVKDTATEEGILETVQAGEHTLVTSYKNKIVSLDLSTGKKIESKAVKPSLLAASDTGKEIAVSYMQESGAFYYFLLKDGVQSEVKLAGKVAKSDRDLFFSPAITSDGQYGYIIFEHKLKDTYKGARVLQFSFVDNTYHSYYLSIGDMNYIYSLVTAPSTEGARFLAGTERWYTKKEQQYDIIDFTLKNGKVVKSSFVSRTMDLSLTPAITDHMAVFCDVMGGNQNNVYVTSENSAFKEVNNKIRTSEVEAAAIDVLQGIGMGVAYIFLAGIMWMFPGMCFSGILYFFDYKISDHRKPLYFVLVYLATAAIKLKVMFNVVYVEKAYLLSGIIAYPAVGIALMVAISLLSLFYGYKRYTRDIESVSAISFFLALLWDSILTLIAFIPFIA